MAVVMMRAHHGARPMRVRTALAVALVLEALVVGGWLWRPHRVYRIPPVKPRATTQVQFVQLPAPKPVVKPIPKPILKPTPKPVLRPKPKPVVPIVHAHPRPKRVIRKPHPHPRPVKVHHRVHVVHHQVVPHPIPTPAPRVKTVPVRRAVVAPRPRVTVAEISAFARRLHDLIQRHVWISPVVRAMGLSGTVRVRFKLRAAGGAAYAVRVVSGSTMGPIRQSAIRTLERLRFPAFPKTLGRSSRTFEVNIAIRADS